MKPDRARRTLALAERVAATLERHQIPVAVIGAIALAVHRYARGTRDVDLAAFAEPGALAKVATELVSEGLRASFNAPDAEDPLGGVLNVRLARADLVQVVNFFNPHHRGSGTLAYEAISTADSVVEPGGRMRAVRLPFLVALKLYAGGPKSAGDVLELLARNPDADLSELRAICERHGLALDLDRLLADRDGV